MPIHVRFPEIDNAPKKSRKPKKTWGLIFASSCNPSRSPTNFLQNCTVLVNIASFNMYETGEVVLRLRTHTVNT